MIETGKKSTHFETICKPPIGVLKYFNHNRGPFFSCQEYFHCQNVFLKQDRMLLCRQNSSGWIDRVRRSKFKAVDTNSSVGNNSCMPRSTICQYPIVFSVYFLWDFTPRNPDGFQIVSFGADRNCERCEYRIVLVNNSSRRQMYVKYVKENMIN